MAKQYLKKLFVITFTMILVFVFSQPAIAKADSSDILGISTGTYYYIINESTGKYLQSDGTSVSIGSRNLSSSQKWLLTRLSSGIYKLTPLTSSNVLTKNSTSLTLAAFTSGLSTQQFTIARSTYGTYTIKNGSYYVYNSGTTVNLSTSYSANSRWTILKVTNGQANSYTFDYVDSSRSTGYYDTTPSDAIFHTVFTNNGYSSVTEHVTSTANSAYPALLQSDVFNYHGHGVPGVWNCQEKCSRINSLNFNDSYAARS